MASRYAESGRQGHARAAGPIAPKADSGPPGAALSFALRF